MIEKFSAIICYKSLYACNQQAGHSLLLDFNTEQSPCSIVPYENFICDTINHPYNNCDA